MGESAGSWSVYYHVLSPLSKGLFRAAIGINLSLPFITLDIVVGVLTRYSYVMTWSFQYNSIQFQAM